MNEVEISLIVPCFNEAEALPLFYGEASRVMGELGRSYELLFVDDGSRDATLEVVKGLASGDSHVKYIALSRNFGKEAAMYAGFCNVDGEYVAVLDADLQDPPSLLPKMLDILENEGFDSVATRRTDRQGEPLVRSWFARLFYRIINRISDADIVDGARDFRLMKHDMVEAIVAMGEVNRFSKGIYGWIGFKTYWLTYENTERVAGETKWNFWGLTKYAINGIVDFSEAPLNLASWSGMLMTVLSFAMLLLIVIRRLVFGDPVAGWASTICTIVFIGGIQLFFMGVMGQYIAKTYSGAKRRPHFVIAETNKQDVARIG